jgi:hypothetical protein
VDIDVRGPEWSQDFLLCADRHYDNPDSDLELQRKHLQEAVDRRAGVLDFGDFICGMQGKYDKRSSKSKLRDADKTPAYLDSLVRNGVELIRPYAKNFVLIGRGNHETGILKTHETDVSTRLVDLLNAECETEVAAGGYSGFVRFQFHRGATCMRSLSLYYHHGSGGGGIVTKGVIQSNRRAAHIDADIYVSGHVHESWVLEIPRTRLSAANAIEHHESWHVQVPSYKEEYGDGDLGFHVEGGRPAKPVGAYWMRFYWRYRGGPEGPRVEFIKARN